MELKIKLEDGQLFINDMKVTEIHFDIYRPMQFPLPPGVDSISIVNEIRNSKNVVHNSAIITGSGNGVFQGVIQQHSGTGDNVANKTTVHIGDIGTAKFEP